MIINHPLLGPRDSEEFVYLGSTDLINRPTNWEEEASAEDFSNINTSETTLLGITRSFGIMSKVTSHGLLFLEIR